MLRTLLIAIIICIVLAIGFFVLIEPDRGRVADPAVKKSPPEYVAPASRDVTSPGMTPGPKVSGPLLRIPGYTPPPEAKRQSKPSDRMRKIIVTHAHTLQSGDITVHIAHIEAPSTEETCDLDEAGRTWPCGRMARTALRRLIRSRAVTCQITSKISETQLVSTCQVGRFDIATWLAGQGWAKPADGAPEGVQAAYQSARDKSLGLWRPLK